MNFAELFSIQIDVLRIVATLVIALLVGLFIYFVYRHTFSGVMYSRNLNVSYVMLTLVTALMLMLINNNLTLSLGMVGALSIIRFRTAVKDPVDTVFMFWAVGEGIAVGVGFYLEAIIASVIIAITLFVLSLFKSKASGAYTLIIHYTEEGASAVKQLMKQLPKCNVKSKSVSKHGMEVVIETRLKQNELSFMDKLQALPGISDAMLVTHQGDIVA